MSGFGERFRQAGYVVPKPLIEVEGHPIIEHIVALFPGESDFVFICNREHLDHPDYHMREILERAAPGARIVAIGPHKLGPVHAVLEARAGIRMDLPTIVNYCDFACVWDYRAFVHYVAESEVDGAVVTYTGFHPHMLGSTNYAYVRSSAGLVQDIREKQSFTTTPMEERASSGTYYFRSGALMLDCFGEARRRNLTVAGEFYTSLTYKILIERGLRVGFFDVERFMQWGTPADLAEYLYYSRLFRRLIAGPVEPPRQAGAVLIPMAGAGARFQREGFALPKPLIPVSGRPMVLQAIRQLPRADRHVFVLRRDAGGIDDIVRQLRSAYPDARITFADALTDGQARTCVLGMPLVDPGAPLTIGACDNGVIFDGAAFLRLFKGADVLVWCARGHPGAIRAPEMFGWLATEGERVVGVSVKKPLADPKSDLAVIGTFTFARAADFERATSLMFARRATVNGEYYVDTCINDALALGLTCCAFEVEHYIGWGTPNDLRTFEYWQSAFGSWAGHPYRAECDACFPDVTGGAAKAGAPG